MGDVLTASRRRGRRRSSADARGQRPTPIVTRRRVRSWGDTVGGRRPSTPRCAP